MVFNAGYRTPNPSEIMASAKSRLVGVLELFDSSTHTARRPSKKTISKPNMTSKSFGSPINVEQSVIFFDVLQDFLPREKSHTVSQKSDAQSLLNVYKGDVVHLIDFAPNNLVEVRLVNRVGQGLVPIRCLAVNRSLTPTISSDFATTPTTLQSPIHKATTLPAVNLPFSSTNSGKDAFGASLPEIKSCQVEAIDLWDNRMWYKIRCVMKTGHHRVLSRFYQDFYSLQLLIKDQLIRENINDIQEFLPTLPSPCGSITSCQVKNRVKELNKYFGELLGSSVISEDIRIDIIQNNWLSPKPGDVVITPRGSTFKLWPSPSGSESWEAVTGKFYNAQNNFAEHLNPVIGMKSRALSFSAKRLTLESPTLKRKPHSAPATPALSTFGFDVPYREEKDIKVKFVYDDECYVAKCATSELQSYQQLDRLCHAKLTGCLPDANFPLMISLINDKQENVVLTEESFRSSIADLHSGKLTSNNVTCFNLKKLVLRVTALK
ncbi:uncharacterized protein LALA0_S09e01398g [Lachancea lanzarotensis]|uniref:LALA0S09e01398g1_1 n=1 Tax=Lachancea lanzarotensis TaxID=1245769 RepID=A0A0C7N743_9SACH|nr:uncharacterized protein LALA0_S09e01398g [Lachancea lanzarotensis]CEP63738.1 LALA0S09e01398g1_1 [Lachancea lanzarotensis]